MADQSASPIGIANLPNQRHKIVAKRGAAFTIMVSGCFEHVSMSIGREKGPNKSETGRWRVGSWQNYFYQHSLLYYDQELCRSQAPSPEAGRQNRRDRDYQGRAGGEVLQGYVARRSMESAGNQDNNSQLTCYSPFDRHRHSRLRRLCQQQRLMDAHHRVPR